MTALTGAKKTPAYWGLVGLCGLLLLLQLILSSLLLLGNEGAARFAMRQQQRLWINAQTGEVIGQTEPGTVTSQNPATLPQTLPEPADNDANVQASPHGEMAVPAEPAPDSMADLMAEFAAPKGVEPVEPEEATSEPDRSGDERFVADEGEMLDAIPAEPRTNASLAAPNPALVEPYMDSSLPVREGSMSPFTQYRRPFTPPPGNPPRIALVVTDLGSIKARTEAASQLPPEVTLAFDPYARHTPAWLKTVRNKGHEAWMMLPAQPADFPASDAGPLALLVEQEPDESLERLNDVMRIQQGYVGLILPPDEIFSDQLNRLNWLYDQLEARGIGLLAAERPENSATQGWLKRKRRARSADLVIDASLNTQSMAAQLSALESLAKQQGHAVGVLRPYPLSIDTIKQWIDDLNRRGFVLSPLSASMETP